jgi:hypothetical protein
MQKQTPIDNPNGDLASELLGVVQLIACAAWSNLGEP